jgi:hypothetical protein
MLGYPSFFFSFRACGVLLLPPELTLYGILALILLQALLATIRIPGGLECLVAAGLSAISPSDLALLVGCPATSQTLRRPHLRNGCHIAQRIEHAWPLLSAPNTGTTAIFSPGNTYVQGW